MNIPEIEKNILEFWQKNNIFKKSLDKKSKQDFVFYDGPPFATGLPHYGHIVASLMKDIIPRYWTMKGYKVERKWGWDCHGLPIENIVEQELKTKSKKDIEDFGIDKFNECCRDKVMLYAK
ncbi:class I tRNA ligase family protein, partial [Patescibacteria group bacterium]|nr:class I tRNA ligase family protein [Patescibacteria group bacterium]